MLVLLIFPFSVSAETVAMNVSAYTWTGNVMANGEYPYEGVIASDDLPIGTRVKINDSVYVVKDRFGGGYTNRIDIYMDSQERAIQFGHKYMYVEVLR